MDQLKIIAFEPDDVPIVGAHLQDAVVAVGDLSVLPGEKRFIALLNRYVWEKAGTAGNKRGERRRSVLRADRVLRVRTKGFNRDAKQTILSLLTVEFTADPKSLPAGTLTLICAGNAAIQMDVECVELVLEDLGPGWEAQRMPSHPAVPLKS